MIVIVGAGEERFEFDISGTQKTINWSPTRSLSESLPKMLQMAKGNPQLSGRR